MITLQNMLNFPSLLSARNDSWKPLRPEIMSVKKVNDDTTIVTGKTGKHIQKIEISGGKTTLASPVKVNCTCESFKFEFAYAVNKYEGLLNPGRFETSLSKPPKEKNKFSKPSGCKHIIAFSRLLTKRITTLRI